LGGGVQAPGKTLEKQSSRGGESWTNDRAFRAGYSSGPQNEKLCCSPIAGNWGGNRDCQTKRKGADKGKRRRDWAQGPNRQGAGVQEGRGFKR